MSFLALLCFNARFAVLITSLFFIIYYFSGSFSYKKIISLGIGMGVLAYLIINFNFGDRLFSQGVSSEDTSIAARIDIVDLINLLDIDLLFFRKGTGISEIQNKFAIDHVENWVLIMVFDVGILLTFYYISMIVRLIYINLKPYLLKDKLYVSLVFIVIASSNNSLATQVPALSFFIASCYFLKVNFNGKSV
jgi:hypothetical protein